jgi:uncharacterized protein
MHDPTLARIEIFPIKSLDGVTLDRATLLASGALNGDRQYAIVNSQGKFVNGKSTPLIHKLRATFSADLTTVTLRIQHTDRRETFTLTENRAPLDRWLSEYFGQAVSVQENIHTGFPDDLNAPGPTIISTATLEAMTQWFPELDPAELRRRFRTNLELSGVPSFWEDQLYGESEDGVPFCIGDVRFLGINPCQRCIVPTRSSLEGVAYPSFQKIFGQSRKETLPDWAAVTRFNHFYKLAVNTRIATESPSVSLALGEKVGLLRSS